MERRCADRPRRLSRKRGKGDAGRTFDRTRIASTAGDRAASRRACRCAGARYRRQFLEFRSPRDAHAASDRRLRHRAVRFRDGSDANAATAVTETFVEAVVAVVGAVIVTATAVDIFLTVIVPRPTGRRQRASVPLGRSIWTVWREIGDRLEPQAREGWLATYAPLLLVAYLAFWVGSLVAGFGLVFFGLRDGIRPVPDLGGSMYFAGTTVLTIGFGDYVPTVATTRAVAFSAGISGLAGLAVVTSFLFPIAGAYQKREMFVLLIANRADRAPSAFELLVNDRNGATDAFASELRDAERWFAQLLETHLAYPISSWLRSTDPLISWLAVTETLLDATALLLTTIDEPQMHEAVLAHKLGLHYISELTNYVRLPDGAPTQDAREFDEAYDAPAGAGIPLWDRTVAQHAFLAMCGHYIERVEAVARSWRISRGRLIDARRVGPEPKARLVEPDATCS